MKTLKILLSPLLISEFDFDYKIVVVIDVLRATSTICAALHNGAREVIPVVSVEEAEKLRSNHASYVVAGERNGSKIPSFDFGNSPLDYPKEMIGDKTLVLTTTNGTKCIDASSNADEILVGSFGNYSALVSYLKSTNKSVVLFCSGWKNLVNLEDTLFAGYVAEALKNDFEIDCDSALIAMDLASLAKGNLVEYCKRASHAKRFERLENHADLEICVEIDRYPVVPFLHEKSLIKKAGM